MKDSAAAPDGTHPAPPQPLTAIIATAPEPVETGHVPSRVAGRTRHRRRPRGRMPRVVVVVVAAVVCALTIGAGTAAAMTKTVTIVVDGQAREVTTLARSVDGALASAGLTVEPHDVLAPTGDTPIGNGSQIVLERGRLLTLSVDGKQVQLWTTATTVDAALATLGNRSADYQVAADRSRAIPLGGLTLDAAQRHAVTLTVGAADAVQVSTFARTVGELLAERDITLGPDDRLSPAAGTRLTDGTAVTITRVAFTTSTKTVAVPQPADQTVKDANLDEGTSTVTQQGRPGSVQVVYRTTVTNGKAGAPQQVSTKVMVAAQPTITRIGTRSTLTWVGNEVFFHDYTYGVNWDGLANCESTHNPQAINANPSAGLPTYGLFQFDLPTWASVGGSGNPVNASPQEQLMRAKLLYQQRGLSPWACAYAAR